MITGLDHVQVACPPGSEDVLRAFYVGVLGMRELTKPPELAARGGVWFRSGTCELHCGVEDGFRPAGKAHPGIAVADDVALDRLALQCSGAGHDSRGVRTSPACVASTSPTRSATGSS